MSVKYPQRRTSTRSWTEISSAVARELPEEFRRARSHVANSLLKVRSISDLPTNTLGREFHLAFLGLFFIDGLVGVEPLGVLPTELLALCTFRYGILKEGYQP